MFSVLVVSILLLVIFIGWLVWNKVFRLRDVDTVSKERSARIDIYSSDMKFDLSDVKVGGGLKAKCDYARWVNAKDQKKYWIAEGGVGHRWEEMWLEFTSAGTGEVLINIRGSYFKDIKQRHHDVWVDDFQVSGAQVKNGDFEMIDPDGMPAYWGWSGSKKRYSTDGSQAHSGKCCALVWHDIPLIQKIKVEAGKKYRVGAWFKAYSK